MLGVKRYLRVGIVTILLLLIGCGPLQATAVTTPSLQVADSPKMIFTELQTTGGSASEEFIELYNMTDSDIDLADVANGGKDVWKLQFFSSTSTVAGTPDWTKSATAISLSGTVPAHDYFLVSSTGYMPDQLEADQTFSSRLSDTGGGVQLAQVSSTANTVHDRVMWQKTPASNLTATVWPTPENGGSLQRVPNDDDLYATDGTLLVEFIASDTISPLATRVAPIPEPLPTETPIPDTTGETPATESPTEPPAVANDGLTAPYLTELMPNPASPLKDETDEYIELYNPNDAPYALDGMVLQVGTTTLRQYLIPAGTTIDANSYSVFYSRDTRLSLTNTSGQAKLLDVADQKLSETNVYSSAPEGQAWTFDNGSWQWSTTATPGVANAVTLSVAAAKTTATKPATGKTTAKKATTKAAAKPKATKAAKAKTTKKKKAAKTALAPVANLAQKEPRTPIHSGILVVVMGAAVLYAAYEYRHDITNRLRRLRGHRGTRAFARA